MLDFPVGEIQCQLTTIAPEYRKKEENTYYRHRHPVFELHFVFKGTCTFKIADESFQVGAGEAILIAPGLYHSIKYVSPDMSKICIGFEIFQPSHRYKEPVMGTIDAAFRAVRVMTLDMGHASEVLGKIRAAVNQDIEQPIEREELKALSALLILELAKKLTGQLSETSAGKTQVAIRRNYIIDEFFNQNFQLSDGASILADQLCVSSRQLDRILKDLYGLSYRQKLQEIRLEIALDLLSTTGKSIAEISELIGYTSPANFSTFVKNACGRTPSEIRRGQTGKTHRNERNL